MVTGARQVPFTVQARTNTQGKKHRLYNARKIWKRQVAECRLLGIGLVFAIRRPWSLPGSCLGTWRKGNKRWKIVLRLCREFVVLDCWNRWCETTWLHQETSQRYSRLASNTNIFFYSLVPLRTSWVDGLLTHVKSVTIYCQSKVWSYLLWLSVRMPGI